ncbi:MAG: molybdopterin dehydrogenase [Alphaproteobacteria bacterium]|nr:molybdopterin dehydrogenase [Alphaproteobacteria bacterium]HCP00240.1 xanthine dehydrogenase family protein subunit M [Rhodospirillaceae bacterium]
MKPAPFTYHDPITAGEAVSLLTKFEDAKVLAGGQSLMPMLNMRFVVPDHVIDLNRIDGIAGIRDGGDTIEIGAMTRQRDLMRNQVIATKAPIIGEALNWVGHFQTRNRGTIGGSLCHLDPAAELPCLMALYDAMLTLHGPSGPRQVPFAEWPLAYMLPSIGPDELLTGVSVPYWEGNTGHGFVEFARRHGDFAIVAVAALLTVDGGKITRAAISIGGADVHPIRLTEAEAALVGAAPNAAAFKAAAENARGIETMSDAYVTSAYRQRLAATLVERALSAAASIANENV